MREVIGWFIEQACKLADAEVCRVANLADDGEMERPTR
jgi:hypothetical protein